MQCSKNEQFKLNPYNLLRNFEVRSFDTLKTVPTFRNTFCYFGYAIY